MRQEHRTQQLALKHQRIGAYEVHHYEERLKSALAALDQDSTIIPTNKELIRSYIKYRAAQGLSIPRQTRYIYCLRKLSRFLNGKHFRDAVKEDLINVISKIEDEDTAYESSSTVRTNRSQGSDKILSALQLDFIPPFKK